MTVKPMTKSFRFFIERFQRIYPVGLVIEQHNLISLPEVAVDNSLNNYSFTASLRHKVERLLFYEQTFSCGSYGSDSRFGSEETVYAFNIHTARFIFRQYFLLHKFRYSVLYIFFPVSLRIRKVEFFHYPVIYRAAFGSRKIGISLKEPGNGERKFKSDFRDFLTVGSRRGSVSFTVQAAYRILGSYLLRFGMRISEAESPVDFKRLRSPAARTGIGTCPFAGFRFLVGPFAGFRFLVGPLRL